ncbi:MAG: hypothetical protein HY810_00960 [Candidatus Omnitrophica bacterium]|nr:hypothetical protein [Candidatus Omnitrophota bacterium]
MDVDKTIAELKDVTQAASANPKFEWRDNPAVQKLLDVIIDILAKEYIEVIKQSPEAFSATQMNTDMGNIDKH